MIRLVAGRIRGFIGRLVTRALELIRWPLPNHAGYRALVVLGFAALPLLPFEEITSQHLRWTLASIAIMFAVWACVDRVIASLQITREGRLAIRAKQVGVRQDLSSEGLKELHSSPWSGLPLLLFVVFVVACTIIISLSSVTYSLTSHFGLAGPFRTPSPGRFDVLLYFVDEASRGVTFHFFDQLGINHLLSQLGVPLPAKLQSADYWWFNRLVGLYKVAITLLTVQVVWLAVTSLFADTDPEVKRLWQLVQRLEAQLHEMKTEDMKRQRGRIFALQRQHDGKLTREQVDTLRYQLNYLDRWYGEEDACDEIRRSLRRDRQVRGLFEFARGGRRGRRRRHWDE